MIETFLKKTIEIKKKIMTNKSTKSAKTTKSTKSTKPSAPLASSEIPTPFLTPAAGGDYADTFIDKIDHEKIKTLEDQVKALKEKTSKKVYAVKLSADLLDELILFIEEKAEWNQAEALGIIEIHKVLTKIKKEGIKDNTIYMESLPLEATHYFISKSKGKGLGEAENFISLYKPFSISLEEVKKDAESIKSLEKEVVAAQQGLEVA